MTPRVDRSLKALHPFHATLLAGTTSLFLAVLLSDIAYAASYEIQWKNFASWLIVGALMLGGITLLWALFGLIRRDRGWARVVYFVLLLAAWCIGFINALVHAEDAWGSMPEGLILSAVVAVLMTLATAFAISTLRAVPLQ